LRCSKINTYSYVRTYYSTSHTAQRSSCRCSRLQAQGCLQLSIRDRCPPLRCAPRVSIKKKNDINQLEFRYITVQIMICHMQNPSSIDPLPMHADAVICRIRPTAGRSVCLGSLHWQFPDQKTWVACMLRDAAAERDRCLPCRAPCLCMHPSGGISASGEKRKRHACSRDDAYQMMPIRTVPPIVVFTLILLYFPSLKKYF